MSQKEEDILAVAIVGLDKAQEATIRDRFSEFTEITKEWSAKAFAIVVIDENDEAQMREAREGRLLLRTRRTDLEKKRVTLKDRSLNEGRAIDAAARILRGLIEPIEAHLLEQESFGARTKETREKVTAEARGAELAALGVNTSLFSLGTMSQAEFEQVRDDAQIVAHTRAEDAKREAKRIADEAAEAEAEKERTEAAARAERDRERAEAAERKLENERLTKAVQDAEAGKKRIADEAVAKQKKAAEALAKQQEQTKKAQAEVQRQKDEAAQLVRAAEDKAKADADATAETARRAAAAPDREKLLAFADQVAAIVAPNLSDPEAITYAEQALGLLAKVAADLRANAAKM